MVDVTLVRIIELPENTSPLATDYVAADSSGGNTSRVQLQAVVNSTAPVATNAQIAAGVDNKARVTPQGLAHALTGLGTGDVPSTRRVDAGQGLAGGGDLSADRTISLDLSFADVRFQRRIERGQANGYPSLDSGGKIPTSQLPDSVLGGLIYQGNWNAATNVPAIPPSSPANKGWFYVVTTAGNTDIDGENNWNVGDWIISDGVAWSKLSNSDSVVSVNGMIGAVVIGIPEIAGLQTSLDAKLDDSQASPFGLTMLAAADAAAGRAALVLGDSATRNVGTTAGTVAAGNDARILDVANKFDKIGGFITPTSSLDWAAIGLNKLASGVGSLLSGTLNEVTRWSLALGGPEPESGSNLGSDFSLNRFADDGTYLGSPIIISRATGDMIFAAPPIIHSAKVDQNGVVHAAYIGGIDTTGTSDASVALQVGLDAIATRYANLGSGGEGQGGQLLLPEGGIFRVDTRLLFQADCPITVRSPGGSRKGTKFIQTASELFRFESDSPSAAYNSRQSVTIDGIFVVCAVANGTAFNLISPEMVKISNIKGYPISDSHYWGQFFNGANIRTSFFADWYVFNCHSAADQSKLRGAAINLTATSGSTDNKYDNLLLQNFNVGWNSVTGTEPSVEGNHFNKCTLVSCNYGIIWTNSHPTYTPPLLVWQNGHMHCYKAWLLSQNIAQVDMTHSQFQLSSIFGDNDAGFNFINVSAFTVADNKLYFLDGARSAGAVLATNGSVMGSIHDNKGVLGGSVGAIQFSTGVRNCDAHNNGFYGASAAIIDVGSDNVTGVNNRILA